MLKTNNSESEINNTNDNCEGSDSDTSGKSCATSSRSNSGDEDVENSNRSNIIPITSPSFTVNGKGAKKLQGSLASKILRTVNADNRYAKFLHFLSNMAYLIVN